MTFHDYLLRHLNHTVMITISPSEKSSFQYNYWNWLHQDGQFHLLKDDLSIGHIIHHGSVVQNEDGSISLQSEYHPKQCQLSFYFGGAIP